MIQTLTKHGNSLALVIEKPVLELIGADADTQFDISTEDDFAAMVLAVARGEHDKADAAVFNRRFTKKT